MNRQLPRARHSALVRLLLPSSLAAATLALSAGCGSDPDPATSAGASPTGAGAGAGSGAASTASSSTSASGAAGGAGGVGGAGGTGGNTLQPDGCYDTLASDVTLDDVTFFQVVAIDALRDGTAVVPEARTAPLVAHRAAVVRAHVETGAAFTAREIGARVTVETSGGSESFLAKAMVDTSGDLMVDIPAAAMATDATYSVAIVECQAPVDGSAPSSAARYPATGDAPLAPVETGTIAIHMLPFEIAGFVPDTSAAVIEGFRKAVLAVYPVTDVTITVAPVLSDWADAVDMGDLLVQTGQIQESDAPAANVYYFGLVTGAATREEFCDDCPTGTSQELDYRGGFAVGAAFADQKAEDTLIHELGHLHMLEHAPCGDPENVDVLFPYADAAIAVEGYDMRTGQLVPPTHKDMMAYCYPRWVSDYNYDKLAGWVQYASANWAGAPAPGNAQSPSSMPRAAAHRCFDARDAGHARGARHARGH